MEKVIGVWKWSSLKTVFLSINQSIFYFMSVHIEVILDKNI